MRYLPCLAGLCLASLAFAQDRAPSDRHEPMPYPALQQRVGGTWLARWNPATATPRAVYGTGLRLDDWREDSLAEARRHAHWALATFGDVIGAGTTSEFREAIGQRMGSAWTFTFDQFFRDLPVIGGRADVRIHSSGVLAMLGSTAWDIPAEFDIVPRIDAGVATAQAWVALGADPTGEPQPVAGRAPRLVIWGDVRAAQKAPLFLAWEVTILNLDANGDGPAGRYYIDATNGRVLRYVNDKHECGAAGCGHAHHDHEAAPPTAPGITIPPTTSPRPVLLAAPVQTTVTVMAWTRTGLSGASPLVNTPLEGLVVDVPGLGPQTTDANGQFTVNLTSPTTISIGTLDGLRCAPINGASAPSASVVVQPGVNATIQLLASSSTQEEAAHTTVLYWVHAVNEWMRTIVGNTSQLASLDQVTPTVNVGLTCNAVMAFNSISFFVSGNNCNNSAFSTVIAHEWGHALDYFYGGLSNYGGDGLSEAWADTVAMYVVDDPIVGLGFNINGGSVRDGRNRRLYPSNTPTTGVHLSGQSFMGMAWKLRENLRASLGTPQAIAVSNAIVMSTIAADARNQPDAVLEIQIADDDDGNLLNGSPHYDEIRAACDTHQLPYQRVVVGTIAHDELGDTSVQLTPRRVLATATPANGSFTSVRVRYQAIGGTAAIRPMIATGAVDEYQALLPGQSAGRRVNYHFEAVHSTGEVVRLPATGDFSYEVNDDVVVFADDFESGAVGWTHASTRVEDDWQLGAPAGRTGAAWADPPSAYSGTHVFGNDLGSSTGSQTGDGAYRDFAANSLRSPVIDCTGQTDVHLRFKRWLTVEQGSYDRASIVVNGTTAWSNSGWVLDRSWQSIDLAIPMADNNPAVQIEWHLDADGSRTFGGWNIDDVQVVASRPAPPLDAQLRIYPEQAAASSPMTLTVTTLFAKPFVLVLGDTDGPTILPGIPPLRVGGNLTTIPGNTNALGYFLANLTAPPTVSAFGTFLYSQVVTLDTGGNVVVTNPHINLFTR